MLAYRLQEQALGRLKPATRRLLRQVADGSSEKRRRDKTVQPRLKMGTVLPREWHGRTHRVMVLEKGFQYGHEQIYALGLGLSCSQWSATINDEYTCSKASGPILTCPRKG